MTAFSFLCELSEDPLGSVNTEWF